MNKPATCMARDPAKRIRNFSKFLPVHIHTSTDKQVLLHSCKIQPKTV